MSRVLISVFCGYLQICQFCQVGELILVFKVEAIFLHVSEILKYHTGVTCIMQGTFWSKASFTPKNNSNNEKKIFSNENFELEEGFSPLLTPRTAVIKTVTQHDAF